MMPVDLEKVIVDERTGRTSKEANRTAGTGAGQKSHLSLAGSRPGAVLEGCVRVNWGRALNRRKSRLAASESRRLVAAALHIPQAADLTREVPVGRADGATRNCALPTLAPFAPGFSPPAANS